MVTALNQTRERIRAINIFTVKNEILFVCIATAQSTIEPSVHGTVLHVR
jgi:hypothetical protein